MDSRGVSRAIEASRVVPPIELRRRTTRFPRQVRHCRNLVTLLEAPMRFPEALAGVSRVGPTARKGMAAHEATRSKLWKDRAARLVAAVL